MRRIGDQPIARAASFQAGIHQWRRNDMPGLRAAPQRIACSDRAVLRKYHSQACAYGQVMSLPSGLCLVTGATGFVGAAVARALVKTGQKVRVLARPHSDRRNLQACGRDRRRLARRPASLAARSPGAAICFTSRPITGCGCPIRRRCTASTSTGTRELMLAAQAAGVERIVYTSSVAVLGHRQGRHRRRGDAEPRRGHDRPLQTVEIRGRGGGARADRDARPAGGHRQSLDPDRPRRHQADPDRAS